MIKSVVLAGALLAPSLLGAQRASVPTSAVANVRLLWEQARDYIGQSAQDMSEAQYAFRPTPDVRTFGELIGHLAGSQNMFCAIALGDKPPSEDAVEKAAKTKAALISAWQQSNTYCAKAYALADNALTGTVDLFGEQRTKLYVLLMNMSHDNEHYGNIVTYMRMNKLVPPSSRPR
jgi:uncharacterized damage-inducible protein DinB